jgi:hypothetical protein
MKNKPQPRYSDDRWLSRFEDCLELLDRIEERLDREAAARQLTKVSVKKLYASCAGKP